VITVKRLTLEDALVLLGAAEKKALEIAVTETICVCDDGGHPLALHRMTGACITGVEIATAKASPPPVIAGPPTSSTSRRAAPRWPATKRLASTPCIRGASRSSYAASRSRWTATWSAVGTAALEAFQRHLAATTR
jgi:uncharacterized protein GlcG (DUF336 family)